ncbi:hypothetical protein DH2020_042244 [Rehmannia glutinosa]|uniref:Uncharacterized protein n=1 Tax=Rehmannia glutinosa TaxID=99300 RepID=A0ABR0UMY3_REHGL
MAFFGYNSNIDFDFDPTPIQASSQYASPYEFVEPELIEYNFSANYTDDSFETPLELNYSVHTYSEPIQYHSSYNYDEYSVNPSEVNFHSEPKFLQYEPPTSYARVYFPSETKFTISYSTAQFNEPGRGLRPDSLRWRLRPGYNLRKTSSSFRHHLLSSICAKSDNTSSENFSYASIPSPYGKNDDHPPIKPQNGSKPVDTKAGNVENGDKVTSDVEIVEALDVIPNNDSPSCEREIGFESGVRGDYGYESERPVSQIPYGSGLETIDICESIFGYWPCLAKIEQQRKTECHQFCDRQRNMDPWKSAADYLFGSPLVYDYENYHHHQQQVQYECYENSGPFLV